MSKAFRTLGGFLLALVLLLSASATALAYTEIDTAKTGSITVTPANGLSIGTELTIYRVADVVVDNADEKYVLTSDFAGTNADLTELSDPEALAATLAAFAADNALVGTTKSVEEDGSVTFENRPLGLYLVIQTVTRPGDNIVNPFLVSVPLLEDDEWVYDVDASPKAETFEVIDVTVNKVWNDGGDEASRPASIKVTLYKEDALLETVTLTAAGNWTYTWTGLDKSDAYAVVETDLGDYEATYAKSGTTFTITNTPELPYTGQLNWPVPLLAGAGLVLFAVGWGLVFLKRKTRA